MAAFKKRPRARWHDYNDGIYFVTIATFNRRHYFGEVVEGAMVLNRCGQIALQQIEMLEQRLDYVEVHNAIVMPNHIHLMVQIISTRYGVTVHHNTENIGALHAPEHPDDDEVPFEERTHYASLLNTAIGGLKSGISREIRRTGCDFKWQTGYHDRIVRDHLTYESINDYIDTNPARWDADIHNNPPQ